LGNSLSSDQNTEASFSGEFVGPLFQPPTHGKP
jgi:hypothetical protein